MVKEDLISRGNKTIAKLMGFDEKEYELDEISFHSSWDRLIPVWCKIEDQVNSCLPRIPYSYEFKNFSLRFCRAIRTNDRRDAWNIVVDSIIWLETKKLSF
jgi:hypothetical protein